MEEINIDEFINLKNSLNPNQFTTTRVGLIPILERHQKQYYILGIDRKTKKLSDFGGHAVIQGNIIESPFECLKREMREEAGILLCSYLLNKMDSFKERMKIFTLKSNATQQIEIFLKFEDDALEIDKIVMMFEPNNEIASIGFYDKVDILKTKPFYYISSVEKFMKYLLPY